MSTSSSLKFSSIKPRGRRNVNAGLSETSGASKSPPSISKLRFAAPGAFGDLQSQSSSTSLTAFEIKKEITSKQLQNDQICALTVGKNLIYLAIKSGKISIFEERMNQLQNDNNTSERPSITHQRRSHVKHKKTAVQSECIYIYILII